MMDLWKSIAGMMEVELTSAEPGAAFRAINEQNIPLFRLQQVSDLTARFRIYRKDYPKLRDLCEKRGETLELHRHMGLFWTAGNLLHRPVLLLGMAALFCLVMYLPTRVLFVRVEGNTSIPTNLILAAAEESGICFGASRREVRSEKIKNTLLGAVPELQWAGVNTSGCVATISVRERTITETSEEDQSVTSIVALRDGVITSCTVTSGTALCAVGQAVKEGQILVSGYTDCGICIRAERSEGEIYAQTNRELTAVTPSQCHAVIQTGETKRKFSLLLGKKRINLWKDSGISDTGCGRMYEECYITLPGGFQLPFGLAVEEYTVYETVPAEILQTDVEDDLLSFAEEYLTQHMVAGRILKKNEDVALQPGVYLLEGQYVCTEMIGKVQREQIGE